MPPSHRLGNRYHRIQMRAGNRPEGKNQRTSAAPVAIVLARSASATCHRASRSPMIPEPTTAATRNAVPMNSAASTARSEVFIACRSVNFLLDCKLARGWKAAGTGTERDSAVENRERLTKRALDLLRRSLTAAGSGTPQCAVIGWPGHNGQTSFAALSQTVKTKSIFGASGFANSSQLLLRKPAVERCGQLSICFNASGRTPRRMAAGAVGNEIGRPL